MKTFFLGALKIADITADLPTIGPASGFELVADEILGCVVHHEGSPPTVPQGTSAYGIANYHVKNPKLMWAHIGYSFVIERDGTIEYTLDLRYRPYHAGYTPDAGDDLSKFPHNDPQYYNNHYWAVCLVGNDPTKEQVGAVEKLLAALKLAVLKAGGQSFSIFGHRELPGKATSCPGTTPMEVIRMTVEQLVNANQTPGASPGSGDLEYFKQFATWRDAAISTKGVADDALRRLKAVISMIDAMYNDPYLAESRKVAGLK